MGASSGHSDVTSVKGRMSEGLKDMRGRIKGLEERLALKKKALGVAPGR